MIIRRYHAKEASSSARAAVAARLTKHEEKFDIVLDHSVWFEGLPQIGAVAVRLGLHIADLVPNNRREIVKANIAALQLDGCVKRDHHVPPGILPTGKANIAHHANESSAWNKSVEAPFPDTVEAVQKDFVISEAPYLPVTIGVFLQCPVWWRGHNKVDNTDDDGNRTSLTSPKTTS